MSDDPTICSFCGKPSTEINGIVLSGPTANICAECLLVGIEAIFGEAYKNKERTNE